jgi:hypothetical protein
VSAKRQLDSFIAKFSPEVAFVARATLRKMGQRLPGATRLVYDNCNALAIGFGPNERASEAIFSIAVFPRWVSLFFLQGAELNDPHDLLKGSGTRVRHIVLRGAGDLDVPEVRALMAQALDLSDARIPATGNGALIIKSISAKQRPRRPTAASPRRR